MPDAAPNSVRDRVTEYFAALSAHDVDRIVACVTDDFVNEHTSALGSTSSGRDVYRGRLPGFLGQFEGLRYQVVDTIVEGERAAVRYRMSATYEDHALDIPGVMLFVTREGLIAQRTDVWDSLTFLRQTGVATE
jgi:ketosteroid isomerase-like protein